MLFSLSKASLATSLDSCHFCWAFMISPVLVTFAEFALISPVSLVCRLSSTAFALMPAVINGLILLFSKSHPKTTDCKLCATVSIFWRILLNEFVVLFMLTLALSCAFILIFICEFATF